MSLATRILKGDIRAASRLMRDIDDHIPSALESLKELYPKTGRAYMRRDNQAHPAPASPPL